MLTTARMALAIFVGLVPSLLTWPASAGPQIAAEGGTCGGFIGIQCAEGLWCDLPAGTCGGADMQGVCKPVRDVCTREYAPVCGCDGKTYANDCERQHAHVSQDHVGACGTPTDR